METTIPPKLLQKLQIGIYALDLNHKVACYLYSNIFNSYCVHKSVFRCYAYVYATRGSYSYKVRNTQVFKIGGSLPGGQDGHLKEYDPI